MLIEHRMDDTAPPPPPPPPTAIDSFRRVPFPKKIPLEGQAYCGGAVDGSAAESLYS